MKKLSLLLLASILIMISSSSCRKKIYGCTDETAMNYSPVANEDAENCVYSSDHEQPEQEVIVSTVKNQTWSQAGTTYIIDLTWSSITQDVLNNGTVDAYMRVTGQTTWQPLPLTMYLASNYSSTIEVRYDLGTVGLIWEDSDLTTPSQPANVDVKVVISK